MSSELLSNSELERLNCLARTEKPPEPSARKTGEWRVLTERVHHPHDPWKISAGRCLVRLSSGSQQHASLIELARDKWHDAVSPRALSAMLEAAHMAFADVEESTTTRRTANEWTTRFGGRLALLVDDIRKHGPRRYRFLAFAIAEARHDGMHILEEAVRKLSANRSKAAQPAGRERFGRAQREEIERLFTLEDPADVWELLDDAPHLVEVLPEAAAQAREHFGDVTCILAVFRDIESPGSRMLTLWIPTKLSGREARARLERLESAWWLDQPDDVFHRMFINIRYI